MGPLVVRLALNGLQTARHVLQYQTVRIMSTALVAQAKTNVLGVDPIIHAPLYQKRSPANVVVWFSIFLAHLHLSLIMSSLETLL